MFSPLDYTMTTKGDNEQIYLSLVEMIRFFQLILKNIFISTRVVSIFKSLIFGFMKHFIPTQSRSITAIRTVKLLKEHGTEVSTESAKLILDFLYMFAKLSVKQLTERDSGKISPEKKTPRHCSNED